MFFPSSKVALNRRGHILFSLSLAGFLIYFLSHYIEIPYLFLIFHSPFFIFGSIMPDMVNFPNNINHRKWWAHGKFLLIFIPAIMSLLYFFWLTKDKFNFLGINFNYYSIGIFVLAGWLSHLLGDSLTSKLR